MRVIAAFSLAVALALAAPAYARFPAGLKPAIKLALGKSRKVSDHHPFKNVTLEGDASDKVLEFSADNIRTPRRVLRSRPGSRPGGGFFGPPHGGGPLRTGRKGGVARGKITVATKRVVVQNYTPVK